MKTKPKAIHVSTPEFTDVWMNKIFEQEYPEEEKTGLYYVVRDKLDKLVKAMGYPNITNPDNRIIEGILIKFDRSNKITGEDMVICNDLWKKYRDKR